MNESCTVKIDYCFVGILSNKEIEKSEVKLFSTQEKAEEFLVDSGFVYGGTLSF